MCAGVLMAGCSNGSAESGPSNEAAFGRQADGSVNESNWPQPGVAQGLAKGLVLPIDPYLETYPEVVSLQRAKNSVQRDCMARFGFDFSPPEPGIHPPAAYNAANMERRYGISDPETAKTYGYAVPDDKSGEVVPYEPGSEAADLVFDRTAPEGKKAPGTYQGKKIPAGGCRGESDRAVGTFDEDLPSRINTQSWEKAKQDPQVLDVNRKWSSCMKDKGYETATPLEAIERSYAPGGVSGADSKSMAVADVECKKSTDLVGVYFSTESRIQKATIEKHQLELDELKKSNETVIKKAASYR